MTKLILVGSLGLVGAVACGANAPLENGGAEGGATGTSGLTCEPGATRECFGPGACSGAQACDRTGSYWGACDCGVGMGGAVSAMGTGGVSPTAAPALVLDCTFDSEAAITNPTIGPSGTMVGGAFVAGRRGNAFASSTSNQANFPGSVIPLHRGTIELWGKLQGFAADTAIPWGYTPFFVSAAGATAQYSIGLNGNDGAGGGALIAFADGPHTATQCYANSGTYGQALGDVTVWHHYAVSWDENGVTGSSYRIQLFLDGNRVGSPIFCGDNHDTGSCRTVSDAVLMIIFLQNELAVGQNVAVDDLKVWNYPKTDFSDSLD